MPEENSSLSVDPEAPLDAEVVATPDAPDENSSTSEPDQGEPKDIFEAVKRATLKVVGPAEDDPSDGTEASPASEDEPDLEGQAKEGKDGENEPPPFHKHKRWQEQLTKYNELQAKYDDLETRSSSFENSHQVVEGLNSFLSAHQLTQEDANIALDIAAMMRNKPEEALKVLVPYVEELQTLTGQRLPVDMQEQVDAGKLDADAAREIVSRTGKLTLQERDNRLANQDVQEREAKVVQQAIATWESQTKAADPDYSKKSDLLNTQVALSVRERVEANRPVTTAEDALSIVKDAYQKVNAQALAFAPAKNKSIIPVTDSGPSHVARPEPKTMLDVVNAAIDGFEEAS